MATRQAQRTQRGNGVITDIAIMATSTSGSTYEIRMAEDGSFWCNCPAWRISARQAGKNQSERTCKHIDGVTHLMAEHFAKVAGLGV